MIKSNNTKVYEVGVKEGRETVYYTIPANNKAELMRVAFEVHGIKERDIVEVC